MLYLIDSANHTQIENSLAIGAYGVTANTSMYCKENVSISSFVQTYANRALPFFSIEVIGTYDEMLKQAYEHLSVDSSIIIKINFSNDGLRLVSTLHKEGYRTALTLVFSISQALAAINAGVDYIFFFIGRNEENGHDALQFIKVIQQMIHNKHYKTKVVAASIKNLYQLEQLAALCIDYAAIPYDLYIRSLYHDLTFKGKDTFEKDFNKSI